MTAYRRVYGFGHMRADCRGQGSAPEPNARFEYGTICLSVCLSVYLSIYLSLKRHTIVTSEALGSGTCVSDLPRVAARQYGDRESTC